MGFFKKVKKISKKITSGAVRTGLAAVTGGLSEATGMGKAASNLTSGAQDKAFGVLEDVSGETAKEEAKEEAALKAQQAADEAAQADKANKEYVAALNRQRSESILGKTKTDYTGDLSEEDDAGEETKRLLASRPLVAKRRALLG